MAKVKSHTASRSGNSGKVAARVAVESVVATRNGETRNFNPMTWNNLPPDKQGWEEVTGKPAEVKTTEPDKEPAKEPVKEPKMEVVKKPTLAELEKVDVSKLTPQEKRKHTLALKAAKAEVQPDPVTVPEGMVQVEVDQEYLDLNPDVAAKGTKVGDIIHVAKGD